MKFLSRDQIETLAKFKSQDFLTTSFYLNTDKSHLTKKEIALSAKNLVNTNRSHIDKSNISKKKKESLYKDLEKIKQFWTEKNKSFNHPGLAVFSCSGRHFWEDFALPAAPRNRIVIDQNPYIRPLSAILDEFHHICALVVDRKKTDWYDIDLGEISHLESLTGDVPSKVREGGWEGYESKRIERHIATHLHDYLKDVASFTFKLFQNNRFDWLFLACSDEFCPPLINLLHPSLKKRLKGHLKAKPSSSPKKILNETMALRTQLISREKEELVKRFISELEKGGKATSGLKNTLRVVNRARAQILIVTRNFTKPGRICPKCSFLYSEETNCPSCQVKTEKVVDVIDEAIESAMEKRCQVKHIDSPNRLSRYGDIGAFLRYQINRKI